MRVTTHTDIYGEPELEAVVQWQGRRMEFVPLCEACEWTGKAQKRYGLAFAAVREHRESNRHKSALGQPLPVRLDTHPRFTVALVPVVQVEVGDIIWAQDDYTWLVVHSLREVGESMTVFSRADQSEFAVDTEGCVLVRAPLNIAGASL